MLADSYYDFGPFRLLPSSRVLLREGRPVALTAKVFDLLVALVENGYTALMQAVVKRNEKAVQIINLLLDQKADINAQDTDGYTALIRAVDFPPPMPPSPPSSRKTKAQKLNERLRRADEIRLMIVKTLVMKGADLNLRDPNGRTALEIARKYRHKGILEILKSK